MAGDSFNLPPGCWDGDQRAPWNQDVEEPEEPRTCMGCEHFRRSPDFPDMGVCAVALSYGEGRDRARDAADAMRAADDGPCDAYREVE